MTISFQQFDAAARAEGFDEVIERDWAPSLVLDQHAHDFTVKALVARGEMWLTCAGATRYLQAGDRFELERGVPHSERYGSEGALVWVARRH